jgi:hypothetical protein
MNPLMIDDEYGCQQLDQVPDEICDACAINKHCLDNVKCRRMEIRVNVLCAMLQAQYDNIGTIS